VVHYRWWSLWGLDDCLSDDRTVAMTVRRCPHQIAPRTLLERSPHLLKAPAQRVRLLSVSSTHNTRRFAQWLASEEACILHPTERFGDGGVV
jgi:hypothetical protein